MLGAEPKDMVHDRRCGVTDGTVECSLFRAKINSDYNDFVARVALEVVDSSWWK
jgi:hypothetical protein